MEWQLNSQGSKLSNQEVAQEILQIYMESLQDHNKLNNILSEYSILDYFGKSFYGQDEVCSHLIANLYGSSFELSSLTTDDKEPSIDWESICENKVCKVEEELGVSLMSTPTSSFPGLAFSTPIRPNPNSRRNFKNAAEKRSPLNTSFESLFRTKKCKLDCEINKSIEGPLSGNKNLDLSPKAFQNLIPSDMRFLSSFGTICYSKQVLSTSDPKRLKHHSVGTPRDRFCHLYIGFQCDEHFISVTNCKIWIIKYGISSKVTPRNLLKSFNESDFE